ENQPGAGSTIGARSVARAVPDGHTLLLNGAAHSVIPALYPDAGFDSIADFIPISTLGDQSFLVAVHPSLPVRNLKEFIALVKPRPGQVNFASAGVGTSPHLSMELFLVMTGLKMLHVPYKGSGPGVTDLVAGHVPAMMPNMLSAQPHIKSGRLRALGVTGSKRAPGAEDIPTIAEAGVPGYEAVQWYGLLAPAATSRDIIIKLHTGVVRALQNPDVRQRLLNDGAEPVGSSPEEFTNYLRAETAKWAKVVQAAGIKPE
ncbi:MAG: tripartite tricarboxylate transporter substrate binding protein, partial [Burkholderiales bacterium]